MPGLQFWKRQPAPADIHSESVWERTQRDLAEAVHSLRFFFWLIACEAIGVFVSNYYTWDHSRGAQTVIGVGAFVGASIFALVSVFVPLWVTAPVRQRNEARGDLHSKPTVAIATPSVSVEKAHDGKHTLRVEIHNHGPGTIPKGNLVNIALPIDWREIQPVTAQGQPAAGDILRDANRLLQPDGTFADALVWALNLNHDFAEGVRMIFHCKVDASPGAYVMQVSVTGHGKFNIVVTIPETQPGETESPK